MEFRTKYHKSYKAFAESNSYHISIKKFSNEKFLQEFVQFKSAELENETVRIEQTPSEQMKQKYNEPERDSISVLEYKAMKLIGIDRCGHFLLDNTPDLFCRVFSELFLFGEGHPNSERPVKVSLEQWMSHYIQLSSRNCSSHPTFTLVAFDIVSRKRALTYQVFHVESDNMIMHR